MNHDFVIPDRSVARMRPALRVYQPPLEYEAHRDLVPDFPREVVVDFARMIIERPPSATLNPPTRRGARDRPSGAVGGPRAWSLQVGRRTVVFTEGDVQYAMDRLRDRRGPEARDRVKAWLDSVRDTVRLALRRFDDTHEVDLYRYVATLEGKPDSQLLRNRHVQRWTKPLFRAGHPTEHGAALSWLLWHIIAAHPDGPVVMRALERARAAT